MTEALREQMAAGYGFDGPRIPVGRPMAAPGAEPADTTVDVGLPLAFLNRHGLIAGATGTGKTRTLQLIAEQASAAGCPVFAADVKGDLGRDRRGGERGRDGERGRARPRVGPRGLPGRAAVAHRRARRAPAGHGHGLGADAAGEGAGAERDPGVEPLPGVPPLRRAGPPAGRPRGPARRPRLPHRPREGRPQGDRRDLDRDGGGAAAPGVAAGGQGRRRVLRRAGAGDRRPHPHRAGRPRDRLRARPRRHGRAPGALLHLPHVGAGRALRRAARGRRPGRAGPPLLLRRGPPPLRRRLGRLPRGGRAHRPPDPLEGRGRLLHHPAPDRPARRGAGPARAPRPARRARVHAQGRRALKQAVETFPAAEHYDLAETLQALGVGEAAVTALDPRGVPTPVAATRLYPPASRMAPLTPEERAAAIGASPLRPRYAARIDRESAAELLEARMAGDEAKAEEVRERAKPAPRRRSEPPPEDTSLAGEVQDMLDSSLGRTVVREVIRGIFGGRRRR